MAEYSAGEDAEAGEESGEDQSDGSCDALTCYVRLGVFMFFIPGVYGVTHQWRRMGMILGVVLVTCSILIIPEEIHPYS